jgi:hypothetical protein
MLRQRLSEQLRALDARITELEQLPFREAHYEHRGIGVTYAEVWAGADPAERRGLLLKAGRFAADRSCTGYQHAYVEPSHRLGITVGTSV